MAILSTNRIIASWLCKSPTNLLKLTSTVCLLLTSNIPDMNKKGQISPNEGAATEGNSAASVKSEEDEAELELMDEELSWSKLNLYLRELQAERQLVDKKRTPHALRLLDEGTLIHIYCSMNIYLVLSATHLQIEITHAIIFAFTVNSNKYTTCSNLLVYNIIHFSLHIFD